MNKYVVPITGYIGESGSHLVEPKVRIIIAESPEQALKLCKVLLHDEEVENNLKAGDSPEEAEYGWANMIWHWEEDGEEEGYIMGDPMLIEKDIDERP